jgi:hypothetical protein
VLYFLMLDRFSDGNENGGHADVMGRPATTGTTPLYRPVDEGRRRTNTQEHDHDHPSTSSAEALQCQI